MSRPRDPKDYRETACHITLVVWAIIPVLLNMSVFYATKHRWDVVFFSYFGFLY